MSHYIMRHTFRVLQDPDRCVNVIEVTSITDMSHEMMKAVQCRT